MSPYVYVGLKEKPKINKKPIKKLQDMLTIISEFTGVERLKVLGRSKKKEIVYARHLLSYFSRVYLRFSLNEVGDFVGGRDHTTVIHSLKTIRNWSETEYSVRKDLKDLQGLIENYFQV